MGNASKGSAEGPGLALPAPAPAPPPDPISSLQSRLLAAHSQARGAFDKTGEFMGRADRAREVMTSLASLGDTITQEDVIKGAGKLVAGGESAVFDLRDLFKTMREHALAIGKAGWTQITNSLTASVAGRRYSWVEFRRFAP